MKPLFSCIVTDFSDIHLVSFRGELDLAGTEGLSDWLVEISGSKLVIDLSELTFIDSSGLAAIIQAKKALGGAVVLTRPQPNVRRVFELTGLSDLLTEWDPSWSPPSSDASDGRESISATESRAAQVYP